MWALMQPALHAPPAPATSRRRRIAHRLVAHAEHLHAWRPTWPPGWFVRLGDFFSTAAAGLLDVVAACLILGA